MKKITISLSLLMGSFLLNDNSFALFSKDKNVEINPAGCPVSLTHDQAKKLRDELSIVVWDGKEAVKLSVFGLDSVALKDAVVSSMDPARLKESFDLRSSGGGDCTYLRTPVRLKKKHQFTVQTERADRPSGPVQEKKPVSPFGAGQKIVEDPFK